MKKFKVLLLSGVVSSLLMTSLFAETEKTDEKEVKEVKKETFQKLRTINPNLFYNEIISQEHFLNKMKEILVIDKIYDNGSTYVLEGKQKQPTRNGQVIENPLKLYFVKSDKTVFAGKQYLTDGSEFFIPLDMNKYKKDAAFVLGKENKNELYIFTDPDCPYCERFEQNADKLVEKGYKINIYLFPLTQLHPDATKKSLYILSQKVDDRAETYQKIQGLKNSNKEWDIDDKKLEEFQPKLTKMINIATDIGISGTPTVLDEFGRKVNYSILLQK